MSPGSAETLGFPSRSGRAVRAPTRGVRGGEGTVKNLAEFAKDAEILVRWRPIPRPVSIILTQRAGKKTPGDPLRTARKRDTMAMFLPDHNLIRILWF